MKIAHSSRARCARSYEINSVFIDFVGWLIIVDCHLRLVDSQSENSVMTVSPIAVAPLALLPHPNVILFRIPVHNAALAQPLFRRPLASRHPLAGHAGVFGADVAVGRPGAAGRGCGVGLAGGGAAE